MSKTPKTDSIHLDDEIESFETRYDWMYDHARELELEVAELKKDKERLDWLLEEIDTILYFDEPLETREDIDEAMNEQTQ